MNEFSQTFPRTSAVVGSTAAQGLQTGCQLYISRNESALADVALGFSAPGVSISADSILLWLSSGKPITAVAIARVWEKGLLELDDAVAKYVPEFGNRGKDKITIRHLLTHTGGIRWANYSPTMPWDEVIYKICDAPVEPRWTIGRTAGYHAFTSWFVLGEIVRRLEGDGRGYCEIVRGEIFEKLGMKDSYLSLTPEEYRGLGDRIATVEVTGAAQVRPIRLDAPEQAGLCVPGAGARGPARELGKFYEMLLRRGKSEKGEQLISSQAVEALTARQRVGVFDLSFKHVVDWGLGFICNSAQYGEATVPYGFGPHASARAFGHGGSQSSVGMADPEYGLVIVVVFNGMPGEAAHQQRLRQTLGAIYEDLGLGG